MESGREQEGKIERHKPEEDRSTSAMESLPPEITLDILSRLPITSLIPFKFACKPWCNLAHDPRLADMRLSCAAENDPCLIFYSDYPTQNQLCFVDIDSHNGYQEKVKKFNIPFRSVMPEFHVVGSCNGFLCLSNSLFGNPQYIYNPFTREYRELPQSSHSQDQVVVFGFGFHPITKEYKLVRIVYQRSEYHGERGCHITVWKRLGGQIFKLGTHAWRDIGSAPHFLEGQTSGILANGSLHWLAKRPPPQNHRVPVLHPFIVSFDLESERFHEVSSPQYWGGLNRHNCHLVALKGCLSVVAKCRDDLEIWTMKDYNVSKLWTREFRIRAYVPVGLKQNVDPPIDDGRERLDKIHVRVVCILKNGEILLEFNSRALVSYDPDREEFKDLTFHGLPKKFQTVIHMGSLFSIDAATEIQR